MKLKEKILKTFLYNEIKTFLDWKKYRPANCHPHGHFYSPIVSKVDLDLFKTEIFKDQSKEYISGIDLNVNEQLRLLKEFSTYYHELPWTDSKSDNYRYYFSNNSYSYTDAIILYSFIRYFKPKRIIEVGSGFSSALMLDTKNFLCQNTNLTFIEPYPDLLYSIMNPNDRKSCTIFDTKVQNVSISRFQELEKNDILFIDSSHVSKTGSDVNYEIFQILPALNSGVLIHFHDIFYPFEYPEEWVYEGKNWNESYLLRAFLSYNNQFQIQLFSNYLHLHHKSAFEKMPLTYKNSGGNLWIKKN